MTGLDRSACGDVVLGVFRALDAGDISAVASLFADDGVWERNGVTLRGPEAVRHALSTRAVDRVTAHVVTNLVIDTEADGTARARFLLTAYDSRSPDGIRLVAIRTCEDRLRCSEGTWRITRKASVRHLPPEAPQEPR